MEEIQEGQTSKNISFGVESIVAWLGARTSSFFGIRISQEETQKLSGIVRNRMTALSLKDPIQYFQLVESQSEEGVAEWEQLLALFMNGETFFFRDKGQFTLLKEHILPTLSHRRKAARSLRILSAGCSTGEGYFLTGHGELSAQTVGALQVKIFPDSVIYQRPQTMCAMSHGGSL